MDSALRTSVRWALVVSAALGVLCTMAMLPIAIGFLIGKGHQAYVAEVTLPVWTRWSTLSVTGVGVMVVGAMCVLLLVSGGWLARTVGVAGAAWFIYAKWAYSVDLYWQNRIANTGDLTPYFVFVTISAVVMLTISVVALVTAARLGRRGPTLTQPSVSLAE